MCKSLKSRLTAVVSVVALSMAFAAPAQAQNQAGDTLVNVQISGLIVQAPITLAANLCDLNVGILARQARQGGAECTATPESIATSGNGGGNGGGNQAGDSLVNVQLSDLTVQAPISVAANLCDLNVGVLAQQVREGGAQCTATPESIASRGTGGGGGQRA